MKILLCAVNAKYIHTNIAVRLIKGYCKDKIKSDIDIAEYTINNYAEDIVHDIFEQHPDIISFSCYIWNIELIIKVSTMLKIIMPDIMIIFGEPEVSYNSFEVLKKYNCCDIVIKGEGEESSLKLYSVIENNLSISDVCGITYRKDSGELISTPQGGLVDMAQLPFPYDDFSETENRICYYEASRGCPFNCRYCLSSIEKGVRFAPIEKVKSELSIFLQKKVRQVKFVDRTFNARNKFACEILKFLIENDNGYTNFHFEVAAEILRDEFLELIGSARKGLFQLEIGVQSTNPETLNSISRTGAFDEICYVSERIKKCGNTHIHLDLIAGLPYEDYESFIKSFNDVHSLYPHQFQLGFLKVLHGSSMEDMCEKYGIQYSPYPPYEVLCTPWLSFNDILNLKKIEDMVERFYNSGRFSHSIKYLIEHSHSPFDAYSRLMLHKSHVFTENLSHNKNDSYVFLLNALPSFDCTDSELFKWILKFDYILHEKPRGTPDWTLNMLNILNRDEVYDMIVRKNIINEVFPHLASYAPKELQNIAHIEKMPVNPITGTRKECIIFIDYSNRDTYGNADYIIR